MQKLTEDFRMTRELPSRWNKTFDSFQSVSKVVMRGKAECIDAYKQVETSPQTFFMILAEMELEPNKERHSED